MFRRGEACGGGEVSFSLLVLFRDSQEKGLVSFLVGGPGGGGRAAEDAACGGGAAGTTGDLAGDGSAGGDHGMDGRAPVMLLMDIFLGGSGFSSTGLMAFVSWV